LPTQLALVFTRTWRLFKGILEEADAILSRLPQQILTVENSKDFPDGANTGTWLKPGAWDAKRRDAVKQMRRV